MIERRVERNGKKTREQKQTRGFVDAIGYVCGKKPHTIKTVNDKRNDTKKVETKKCNEMK